MLRWVWRTHGLWLVLTAIVVGLGGYLVMGRLLLVAEPLEAEQLVVAGWVRRTLNARAWLMLPAAVIALCGVLTGRGRWPWHLLWLGLGAALALIILALLLGCFVGVMSPLYRSPVL